jgi:hypothetical protein
LTADTVRWLKNMQYQWHCSRCIGGLHIGGLPDGKLTEPLRGVFTRDAKDPNANGRPHWSTTEGGHLYYSITGGAWYLSMVFAPDKTACAASFATAGELPTGQAAWRCWDCNTFVERKLTVAELSPAEVVEVAQVAAAERAAAVTASFAQAERMPRLHVGGLPDGKLLEPLRGVFTRDSKDPDANGRPHWSTTEGGHLYYSITAGAWYLTWRYLTGRAAAYFVTAGEVPTGEAAWRYWDGNSFVERKLTLAELSPAEVVEAARAAAAEPHDTGCSTVARKDWFAQATGL